MELYNIIREVLQTVYRENRFYFQPEVPLFSKLLTPGMSLAEEPNYKFAAQESFGMNRCQIVANGLMAAWQNGKNSPEELTESIRQEFSRLGIELQRPYLNANSEDIYEALF
ncbi:MAG: T3SS effector HopA1 family protein [Xenococcus sp. MO_188.B8]|nr:T3SS effector HopA1 family protein [Xenococcus sp. MO_188.B8]